MQTAAYGSRQESGAGYAVATVTTALLWIPAIWGVGILLDHYYNDPSGSAWFELALILLAMVGWPVSVGAAGLVAAVLSPDPKRDWAPGEALRSRIVRGLSSATVGIALCCALIWVLVEFGYGPSGR